MTKHTKRTLSMIVLMILCLTFCVFAAACGPKDPPEPPEPPVKVADGIDFELGVGDSKNLTVADYITAYNNAVTAASDSANATASVAEGLLTVTGVAEGDANVQLTCGDITVTFGVTVYAKYAVKVDGEATYVKKGDTFTLPAAPAVADTDFEFDYWLVGEEHKNPGDTVTVDSDITVISVTKRKAPVKVADGGDVLVSTSGSGTKQLNVADYITAHGATVTAESDDENTVTAEVKDGKIVFTAVADGTATVTVTCGSIEIEFAVTVTTAAIATHTVTVNGNVVATVDEGDTYRLPAAVASSDQDFEFVGWKIEGVEGVKRPNDMITVDRDLVIEAKFERKPVEKLRDGITLNITIDGTNTSATIDVTEYINKHGNTAVVTTAASQDESTATAVLDGNTVTVTAVAEGNTTVTLTCGDVTVTFTVNVTSVADGTPVFDNGNISFDLYSATSGTYPITDPTVSGYNYSYTYSTTTAGASISGNTVTYTTSTKGNYSITVNVTATDAAQGVTKTTSFTVSVTVTDTTPVASDTTVTDLSVHDLFDGAFNLNLTTNIDNPASYSGSYKVSVNGAAAAAVADPTAYSVTGNYNDSVTDVALTVTATFGTKTVTYTYNVKVKNTAAYRLTNGGFDNDLDGWMLSNNDLGAVNNATKYWNEEKPYNSDGKFFNAYTNLKEDDATVAISGNEGAKGTLTSSTFTIGGSGWITYMIGGARESELVYIEVVESGTQKVLDRFGNELFSDADLGGCKLIPYKANLSMHKGKTAFIRVTDNSSSNYGLFFVDEFVTYYATEPANTYNTATSQAHLMYQVANGGFEYGNHLDGWTFTDGSGQFAAVTDDNKYFADVEYGKDGNWLLSGAAGGNHGNNPDGMEANTGVLKSSNFILKANTWISFKLGGGNGAKLGIRIVKINGTVLAEFNNTSMNAAEGSLVQYVYKFSDMSDDVECYVEIFDDQTEGIWKLVTVDSIVTYYAGAHGIDGAVTAINQLTA